MALLEHLTFLDAGQSLDNAIQGQFESATVLVSVLIACVAAYTAFLFSERISSSTKKWHKLLWLTSGSFSLGVGIWAMHFTGMLAYQLPFDVYYDKIITLASILPVVLASAVIFMVSIFHVPYWWCLPMQSVLMGSGIGMMHFVGMAAMQMDAQMHYEPAMFGLSILAAIVLSFISLRLKLWAESSKRTPETYSLLFAAIVMGLAISSMHYTGMAAAYYFPIQSETGLLNTVSSWAPDSVMNMVGYTVLVLLLLMVGAVHLSRRLELLTQLKISNTRQLNIVENMVDGLIVIDRHGLINSFNPAAEKMFGYTENDVINENVSILMSGSDGAHHDLYLQKYFNKRESDVVGIDREIMACRKGGELFPIEIALSKYEVDGEIYFTGVARDISERKEIENRIHEARRAAEVASHAKSEFLNRVSHELRTPMNAIMGFGQLLESDMDCFSEEHRTYINELKQASLRLLRLIDGMLDLSSYETNGQQVTTDEVLLRDIVLSCISDMTIEAQQAGIEIENQIDNRELIVMADVGRIQQVLEHLISNAIRHNSRGGKVILGYELKPANRVRINVADTGPGLDSNEQQELFTPFDRLNNDPRLKGVGMGLAISKHLMESMGGTIGVESQPGVGSNFWIELNLMADQDILHG